MVGLAAVRCVHSGAMDGASDVTEGRSQAVMRTLVTMCRGFSGVALPSDGDLFNPVLIANTAYMFFMDLLMCWAISSTELHRVEHVGPADAVLERRLEALLHLVATVRPLLPACVKSVLGFVLGTSQRAKEWIDLACEQVVMASTRWEEGCSKQLQDMRTWRNIFEAVDIRSYLEAVASSLFPPCLMEVLSKQ
jgi:hypothetical protein